MDERILNKICIYQKDPENFLSCCKNFTLERICNIRWKNRIYFKDNRIKLFNCEINNLKYKHLWLKEGKEHRDDIDPKTGITIYSSIGYYDDGHYKSCLYKYCYKNGKNHCDDIDPNTGITFPAQNSDDGLKFWYKNGKNYRDDIDPNTGLTLYTEIYDNGAKIWYKDEKLNLDDIDPETGLILPSVIFNSGLKEWYKDGKEHRDDIDPDTGLTLPAQILEDGSKFWYKDGIEFDPNFEITYSFFSKHKKKIFLSIGAILPILYFIHKK